MLPPLGQLRWQVRTSADKKAKMTTEAFMHGPKEETPPATRQASGNANQLLKLFLPLLPPHLPFDAMQKELQCLGYQHGTRHLLCFEQLEQSFRYKRTGVDYAGTAMQKSQLNGHFEHMTEW